MRKQFSHTFYSALTQPSAEMAILLYTKEIEDVDPKNFHAWHNRGLQKVFLGQATGDSELISGVI